MSHATRVETWLREAALPLWSHAGIDRQVGGFTERLTLEGAPDYDAPKRLRVQARQIYVFSHAYLLGLCPDGADLAMRSFDFISQHGRHNEGGYVRSLTREGAVVDPVRDLYDHAFLLYAFGWLYRATSEIRLRKAIYDLTTDIDTHLKRADGRGYRETDEVTAPQYRLQNPHMHLFEAYISAYCATMDDEFLKRGSAIQNLFREGFFDKKSGALHEYFDDRWHPASGDAGRIAEPGHQMEWVWLLHKFAALNNAQVIPEASALYDFAQQNGIDPATGLVIDEIWDDGSAKKPSKRSWPQTEALKAEIARSESAGTPLGERAGQIIDNLFTYYLDKGCDGGWCDQLDEETRPASSFMPASTFYHVFLAFAEYLRVAKGLDCRLLPRSAA